MTIKLIAIDLDGTLLNSQNQVSERTKKVLKEVQAKDIKIVLCTGRPITGVQHLLKELNLTNEDDYVITYNGSLVQNTKTNEVISSYELTFDDYLDIDLLARKIGVHLHTETRDTMYTANRDISLYTTYESYLVNMPIKYRTQEEMSAELNIIKMMMVDEPEILDKAILSIPEHFYERFTIVKSTPYFLEILNKEVHKGVALTRLAKHLNIQQDEIMALGDNGNDLTMIEYAGIGVAMGNAIDTVKEVANEITASNDDDGVAKAIEKFVL